MRKGKANFLLDMKHLVDAKRSAAGRDKLVLDYLRLWIDGDEQSNPSADNARWLKEVFDALDKRLSRRLSIENDNIARLFYELGLCSSSASDQHILIAALAQAAFPAKAGANQKWDAAKFDDFWRDVLHILEKHPNLYSEEGKIKQTAMAEKLLDEFPGKYRTRRRNSDKRNMIDNLKRRVGDAANVDKFVNPNLFILDFDYLVRGDAGVWPSCAAGLPRQPSLRQRSAEWNSARAYEEKMVGRTLAMLSALGVYVTGDYLFGCRRAARQIARARAWRELKGNSTATYDGHENP